MYKVKLPCDPEVEHMLLAPESLELRDSRSAASLVLMANCRRGRIRLSRSL